MQRVVALLLALTGPPQQVRPASAAAEVDLGLFARVVTSDPDRRDGARAGRLEEFRAEDVFLTTELAPQADGTYTVPAARTARGTIGLEWAERRVLRRLVLEFAAPRMPPAGIELQYWSSSGQEDSWSGIGQTPWQGRWERLPAKIESEEGRLVATIPAAAVPEFKSEIGVLKIRWLFPAGAAPLVVKRPRAFGASVWQTAELLIEAEGEANAKIAVYNGLITDAASGRPGLDRTWNTGKPLRLGLVCSRPSPRKADRTLLRFHLPAGPVTVAVEDVLTGDGVYVRDFGLLVRRADAPVGLAEYRRKIAGQSTILARVRTMPDQSFDQAMRALWRPIQNNGPTMLSLACDNEKFILDREGTIRYGRLSIKPQFPAARTRSLEGRWLPIVVNTAQSGGAVLRQRTWVAPFTPTADPWDSVGKTRALGVAEFALENPGGKAVDVAFRLGTMYWPGQPSGGPIEVRTVGKRAFWTERGRVLAVIDLTDTSPLATAVSSSGILITGRLPAAATCRFVAYVPAWPLRREDQTPLPPSAELRERVVRYWEGLMRPAMQVELPEPLLEDVYRATQVHCLTAARNEAQGRRVAPWIASDTYGPLDTEAQPVILGMDLVGHAEFARRSLEFFISSYNADGLLVKGYTLMGTGQHLWTLAAHDALVPDRRWLAGIAPEIFKSCRWIVRQTEKTKRLDARGQRLPEYGLVPPGVLADWNRYAYYFYANGHFCAGLEAAGRMLAAVRTAEAQEIQRAAQEYREDILRAFRWQRGQMPVVRLRDGTWVPPCPSSLYCYGLTREFFGGVSAIGHDVEAGGNHLIPLGLLEPKGREADWVADFLEDRWFLIDGIFGAYPAGENEKDWFNRGGFAKLQPHYARTSDIHALRDDVKPFVRTYFNTLPVLLNRENLSFWEHANNGGAWNKTHESAWFLEMTRTMLLTERGDELWLAPFVTNRWMRQGMHVSVRNAPTRFGAASYTLRSAVAEGHIDAVVKSPARRPPTRLVLRVRHPEGRRMRGVTVDGVPHADFDPAAEIVRLAPSAKPVSVRVIY